MGPPSGGPGVAFRHLGGGAGQVGSPGADLWNLTLGRFWAHSGAERIVESTPTDAVLITKQAGFLIFSDGNGDDLYEFVAPSDEYLELTKTGSGWELRDLVGTTRFFDTDGLWTKTREKDNPNLETVATYSAEAWCPSEVPVCAFESIAFPDGRTEDFAYEASGKLDTITLVGVDGMTTRVWEYIWDGDDLERIDMPDGRAWEFRYEDTNFPGYLTQMILVGDDDSTERVVKAWSYDSSGNVHQTWRGAATSTDSDAVDLWEFSFDDPSLPGVTTVTDPLGDDTIYTMGRDTVSLRPKILSIEGGCPACGLGPNTQLQYDDVDHPMLRTRTLDCDATTTDFTYNDDGRLLTRTEAVSEIEERVTEWFYDDATFPGLVTEMHQPSVTGNPSDERKLIQTYTTTADMDTSTIEGFEDGNPFSLPTGRTYNTVGQVLTIDPPGFTNEDVTTFTYDPTRGDLVPDARTDPVIGALGQTSFGYDAFNRRTSTTDPNGLVTETEYDELDRIEAAIQRGPTPAEDLVTDHVYNTLGDLFQTILPRGNVIEYTYDQAGRLTTIERKPDALPGSHGERTVFTLDKFGNRTREEQQRWNGTTWVVESATEFVYNTRCFLDQVIAGEGSPEESTTEFKYDCDGNLEEVFDGNQFGTMDPTWTYSYDPLNRLVEARQTFGGPAGGDAVTTYGYDVQDHLTAVTDAEGNVTTFEYSDRDLLTKEISPVSGTTTHTYDEHGNRDTQTDARGVVVDFDHDALDRPTHVSYPDSLLDVVHEYDDPAVEDSIGRLTAIERSAGIVLYEYDHFGRSTRDGGLRFGYDENGYRTEIVYVGQHTATYTPDFADRDATLSVEIMSPVLEGGSPVTVNVVTASAYAPSGPLASLTFGNDLVETRAFDSRYFPDGITVTPDDPPAIFDWDYTTDDVGNVTEILDEITPANDRTYAYQPFQYFLTQGDGPWGALDWTYDKIGNRLTETRDGGNPDTYTYHPNCETPTAGNTALLCGVDLGMGGSRDYTFGPAGHLEQVDAGANQITFTTDDEGRLAKMERFEFSTLLSYDGRSFLTRARSLTAPPASLVGLVGRGATTIFIDGFETGDPCNWSSFVGGEPTNCPVETENLTTTYDSDGLLHARKAQSADEIVLYFAGRPVGIADALGQAVMYITTDHLGTPVLATDQGAAIVWKGGFEPFGGDWQAGMATGANENGMFLRFPGQWDSGAWDDSAMGADLYYNVHRWLETATGRYQRPDPLGFRASTNLYAYALANPTSRIDPLGLVSWRCSVIEISASATIVGAAAFFVDCKSECVEGVRSEGTYIAGGYAPGIGLSIPGEVGFWEVEDGTSSPDPGRLEGAFTLRGCSITPVIGVGITEVTQGQGRGGFSPDATFGLGIGCMGVAGGVKLVSPKQTCCRETGSSSSTPTIGPQ